MAERLRTFRRAERESESFLDRFYEGGTLAATQGDAAQWTASPVADVYRAGFREITLNPRPDGSPLAGAPLEALGRMLRKSASSQLTRLERSLGFLATTASATPFIGLFGTVWGIMDAFHGIGMTGSANLGAVAPGIAEALITTAAGLAVAIPGVIAYNYFLNRIKGVATRLDLFGLEFLGTSERIIHRSGRG
jgi:biopolymer transport protein TolQ